jgi:hypothetical protein
VTSPSRRSTSTQMIQACEAYTPHVALCTPKEPLKADKGALKNMSIEANQPGRDFDGTFLENDGFRGF